LLKAAVALEEQVEERAGLLVAQPVGPV